MCNNGRSIPHIDHICTAYMHSMFNAPALPTRMDSRTMRYITNYPEPARAQTHSLVTPDDRSLSCISEEVNWDPGNLRFSPRHAMLSQPDGSLFVVRHTAVAWTGVRIREESPHLIQTLYENIILHARWVRCVTEYAFQGRSLVCIHGHYPYAKDS